MNHSRDIRDEAERFAQDVELLLDGQAIEETEETCDDSYQADLALAHLLSRARFVPDPRFRARLRSQLLQQLEEVKTMSPVRVFRSLVRPVLVAGLSAVLVLGVLLVVSPDIRAAAQQLLVRFVEVDSPWALLPVSQSESSEPAPDAPGLVDPSVGGAELPAPSDVPAPSMPEGAAPGPDQMLVSLEEAEAETTFTVKKPATLPEGYSFKGVVKPPPLPELDEPLPADSPVSGLPSAVILVFENAAGEKLMLGEFALAMNPLAEIQLPAGKGSVQEVMVNGQPGQYVEGAWSPEGWRSDANHHVLHWQGADGVVYDLSSEHLGLEELLRIAESIP